MFLAYRSKFWPLFAKNGYFSQKCIFLKNSLFLISPQGMQLLSWNLDTMCGNKRWTKVLADGILIFCFVSLFSPLLHNNLLMLRNNGEKSETKRKIKILSSNFCSPLISAHCVQISAQKLHSLWRNKKKTAFEKKRNFVKNGHFFAKNGQNFGR